jgi:hypothetical protein
VAAFRFLEVFAIPVQGMASDGAAEQIVHAQGAAGTDEEET